MRSVAISILAAGSLFAAAANAFTGDTPALEIHVAAPEGPTADGLKDIAAAYQKETGTWVYVVGESADKIAADAKTAKAVTDVVVLPVDKMTAFEKDGGVLARSRKALSHVPVDTDMAVSIRSQKYEEAMSFMRYIARPSIAKMWKDKGVELR